MKINRSVEVEEEFGVIICEVWMEANCSVDVFDVEFEDGSEGSCVGLAETEDSVGVVDVGIEFWVKMDGFAD